MEIVGKNGSHILFSHENDAVIVDVESNVTISQGSLSSLLASAAWDFSSVTVDETVTDLARAALTTLDVSIVASAGRMYTIPKGAQSEAERGLAWHNEHNRGGTSVGINTARRLAKGGQIGIEKVRHIAKYFPRHEVDKKAKGYRPGEDNFPSNGRIAWALWGGDTAWKWAQQIVEREKNKAIKADGYADNSYIEDNSVYATNKYDADVDSFSNDTSSEFIARMHMDGSGIDRLYKIDENLTVSVWDAGFWNNLPGVYNDLASYDAELDNNFGSADVTHVEIDTESALFLSACFQEDPNARVSLFDVNYDEAMMMLNAAAGIDMEFIDRIVTAAGAAPSPAPAAPGDGNYTPEERAKNAQVQVRDKTGRFAKSGSSVVVGGDASRGSGKIVGTNPVDGTIRVRLNTGTEVSVPGSAVEPADAYTPSLNDVKNVTPLDVSGILGEPRAPIDRPDAKIPGTLPRLGPEDLAQVLYDFPGHVKSMRDGFTESLPVPQKVEVGKMPEARKLKVVTGKDQVPEIKKTDALKELEKLTGTKLITDPYKDPLLSKFLNKKVKGSNGQYYYPNKVYFQPLLRASGLIAAVDASEEIADKVPDVAGESREMTPTNSDVQPIFFAIVANDDPGAVLDLIALVPASSTSTDPMAYSRIDKSWVRNETVISDLGSPTPPPVIPLDGPTLKSVIEQIDGIVPVTASVEADSEFFTLLWGPNGNVMVMTAAGGADKNRGNAETLRRYWTRGKGAAKIRWGTKGDWSRCVRHLAKYLGPRAKGYCQLRHKDALGFYTSTHAKRDRARNNSVEEFIMETPFDPLTMKPFTEVTKEDMDMPIDAIYITYDDLYDHEWEPEEHIVRLLEDDELMAQECDHGMTAAGGADKNRGNAETLRKYWTVGKGGLKIRWNTPGDWTRCYRHLKKYMGPRAKGYCSLRHKETTGMWPGDSRNPGMKNNSAFAVDGILSYRETLDASILSAKAQSARRRVLTASGEEDTLVSGYQFSIPLVLPEGVESGDGRQFDKGSIEIRELPLPLMWQIKTDEGHNGSVVVGRIDSMERTEKGIGNARGVFDSGAYGKEAERLVREGFIRGVSADLDQFEANEEDNKKDNELEQDSGKIENEKLVISHARVMAVTLVPKPAFQECQIYLVNDENKEDTVIPDGTYVDEMDPVEASALVACGLVAGSIPVVPPSDWFSNPELKKATPLTVDDSGRVYGHIAAWHVDHIGMSYGTKPPRSKSKYAFFHTGVVRTDAGTDVPVGQLTLAGGHASLEASASEAVRHYDDTASAIADVHAGEDSYGIWVSGALRPGTSPEQIRALRASAPSGDWRPIKGNLELVAVCQVNVPGFPIARARVASGAVMALVAAGANVLARMKSDPVTELAARIEKLEQLENAQLSAKADAARARFSEVIENKAIELSIQADALYERIHGEPRYDDAFASLSRPRREKLAREGKALPDGSFPITSAEGVKDAIQAYGRAKPGKRAAVRRHIIKMARKHGVSDVVPEEWKTLSTEIIDEDIKDLRSRVASISLEIGDDLGKALAVEAQDKGIYTPKTQPRDEKGKFREVLARIKQDLGTSGSQDVMDQIAKTEKLNNAGNYVEAAASGAKLISIIDRLDANALNPDSIENIRSSARELGKVVANLPFSFGNENEKMRYSDLPPALKNLLDDMITRVEDKIGKKDADQATVDLKSFMRGGDYFTQQEISSQLSKLLRLLT